MIDLREVLLRADRLERERGIWRDRMIFRCGAKVRSELYAQATMGPLGALSGLIGAPLAYGMPIVVDKWLPPDVWRITDRDHTLLWDSRMVDA